MRLDPNERSENVEDYRGRTGGGGGGIGGGGMRFGIGTIVVLIIAYALGFDPRIVMGLLGAAQQAAPAAAAPSDAGPAAAADDPPAVFVSNVLRDTEKTWSDIFRAGNAQYEEPKLVLFTGGVQSGCGGASTSSGPFYCPADQKLYIDLAFYQQLDSEFNAPGDFAQAYVIAHEVGHHVQNLLGTANKVRQAQSRVSEAEGNMYQVMMELQADCYAGIWAHHSQAQRQTLEPGDIEEGMRAASAVGDDTIQKRMQGYVVPESFTHGSAQQRMAWFKRGFETGSLDACDTFSAGR